MADNEEDQRKVQATASDLRLRLIIYNDYVSLVPLTTNNALSFLTSISVLAYKR